MLPIEKQAIVRLENIGVTYSDGVVALESLSLQLNRGEFVVVLGSSGAGKSTLLRTVNYLNPPTQGSVLVRAGDSGTSPISGAASISGTASISGIDSPWKMLTEADELRSHRKQTGMIFQQHQLLESQSALQNVLTGRLAYYSFWRSLLPLPKRDQKLALASLSRVGLIDKALTPVKNLSGGQKQRVGIARALAQQPQLMLADEPIASLDPASAHNVLSLLRGICKTDGISALLSLHQVEFAKEYGDRIIGLANGQVVFDAAPSDLSDRDLKKIYASQSVEQLQEEEEKANSPSSTIGQQPITNSKVILGA
ncbi:MAG: phosphonate ABC transporter ATP-binding protein [Cyanobacteria bacterium P01_D01_bin.1]